MAIHSQRHGVCVCVAKGKTILGGGCGGAGSPSCLASTVGGGDAADRDILFGGGAGRIHHDVHYVLKYKST